MHADLDTLTTLPYDRRRRAAAATGTAAPSGFASSIRQFLIWLGASLAGMTALLYASGYLVTRAHLHMLGLYGFVEFDNNHSLQEGAKYLLAVAYNFAETAVLLSIALALGLALLAAPIGLTRWLARGRYRRQWRCLRVGWYRRVPATLRDRDHLRAAAYVGLFALLIALTGAALYPFYAPLCVADLLYHGGNISECAGNPELTALAESLRIALLSGHDAALAHSFDERLSQTLYLGVLAAVAWRVAQPWRRWRTWLTLPFVAVTTLFLLLLPMDYGVLKRPTVYPVIHAGAAYPLQSHQPVYLLKKSEDAFVLWDPAAQKVLWVPTPSLSRAEIVGMRDLFALTPGTAYTDVVATPATAIAASSTGATQ